MSRWRIVCVPRIVCLPAVDPNDVIRRHSANKSHASISVLLYVWQCSLRRLAVTSTTFAEVGGASRMISSDAKTYNVSYQTGHPKKSGKHCCCTMNWRMSDVSAQEEDAKYNSRGRQQRGAATGPKQQQQQPHGQQQPRANRLCVPHHVAFASH